VVHYLPQPDNQRGGQRIKALPRAHQVQIMVRHQSGQVQDLIEHFAVLTGRANHRRKARIGPQRGDYRKQLDRFGSCPEYDQELFPARRVYHLEKPVSSAGVQGWTVFHTPIHL